MAPPIARTICQASDPRNTPTANAVPAPGPARRCESPAVRATKYTAVMGLIAVSPTNRRNVLR